LIDGFFLENSVQQFELNDLFNDLDIAWIALDLALLSEALETDSPEKLLISFELIFLLSINSLQDEEVEDDDE
jgi:hypothetical protein